MPNIVGLTGGIACGKTLVSRLFEQFNVEVFDADVIARELVIPGQAALNGIVKIFGHSILKPDGYLNREKLRQIIFTQTDLRKQLEDILHPRIYRRMQQSVDSLKKDKIYCVFSIPLLIETQATDKVDRVLIVDCSEETQLQRVQRRDQSSLEEAKKILATQCNRQTRLACADDVIQNDKGFSELKMQVEKLHHDYLYLFSSHK